MLKSRVESKPGVSISCFDIPFAFVNDKLEIKRHFQRYGKVIRIFLRPKRNMCVVEFDNEESVQMALQEGGNYQGQTFRITQIKPKSAETIKIIKKVDKKPDWKEDPDVLEELKAMQGAFNLENAYSSHLKAKNESPSVLHKKHRLKKETVKPLKPVKPILPRKKENRVPQKPKEILPSINTEQATELLKLITQRAETAEQKYRILDARDKLLRMRMVKQSDLSNVGKTIGTCPDMCPEKERLMRVAQHQVALYEQIGENRGSMDHSLAVKQYSRSSADQESPLAHELRPVKVLEMTMGYLLHRIVDMCESPDVNLAEWYHFLWDRTRGIRKDITQQELCCQGSVRLLEQCARFHIHCSARLVAEDSSVFDQKINTENLTKCLQTLKYMYHDLAVKDEKCPNEAEFRGYIVLLNLNDGNFMWEIQQLSRDIQESPEVKFALKVYSALDKNNYVRFFKYVQSTTYLNACILLRYFNQVRLQAIRRILKSYSPRQPYTTFPISELTSVLAFENTGSTIEFLEYYGLSVNGEGSHVLLDRKMFSLSDLPLQNERAVNTIESKRICSVGEVICGSELPPKDYLKIIPHNSFDNDGYIKSLEIPSEWRSKCRDISFEQESSANESMDLIVIQDSPEKEKPLSNFTFCLPSKPAFSFISNIQVPVAKTTFSFTNPENLHIPVSIQENKKIDKNLFKSIASKNIPTKNEVIDMDTTDNVQENIICEAPTSESVKVIEEIKPAPVFKPTEPVFSFKPITTKPISSTFNIPPVFTTGSSGGGFKFNLPNFTIAQKSTEFKEIAPIVKTTEAIIVPKINEVKTKIKENTTNIPKMPIFTPEVPKQTVFQPTIPKEIFKSKKVEKPKIIIKESTPQKYEVIKEITRKKAEEELIKDVKIVVDNVLNKVEKEIEKTKKLVKLTEKIKKRKIINYVKKWRNNVLETKNKRQKFYDNSFWISDKTITEEAKELYISSQNIALNNKKRYLDGKFDSLVPPIFEPKVSKLNVYQIVGRILYEKTFNFSEHPNLNLFWKIGVSITRNNTRSSQNCEKFIYSALGISKEQDSILEVYPTENGGTLHYCLEKINVPKNDLNGMYFIVDFSEFNKFSYDFNNILTNLKNPTPILIIILNYSEQDKCALINKLNLNKISYVSNYEIVLVKNITLPIIIASVQWLAHNLEAIPSLEMDLLTSVLHKCIGDEFLSRLEANTNLNNRLKILIRDPNVLINLFNEGLNIITHKIFNVNLNSRDFPSEFKKYLNTNFIKLPCSYEYFPENWKTDLTKIGTVIKSLYLPQFEDKWPLDTLNETIISIENYCDSIFDNYKAFNSIISFLTTFMDFEKNNSENINLIQWTDILKIIIAEKISDLNKKDALFIVYNIDDIKELQVTPWWYQTKIISEKIKFVEENDFIDDEDFEDSDEEIIEFDVNGMINEATEIMKKEEDVFDEDMKKDYEDLNLLIDDLEESMAIQKKIMMKFNEMANSALDDSIYKNNFIEE